ncbi:hypothetical protein BAJUN_00910 [Bajunvirus bajun]|uniref:Uncharacterized protein n=1 Tax=Brevundimonas phage vB_BgoS-Bajun TaxID=2948594 RepID=A0A9E7ST89_9CAUD|nr:hypothetical protein BAJUN_00910 [Brevundimonas phage vB_BgoS-Bajun]
MRRNGFNELYLQPDDDLIISLDQQGKDTDLFARLLEDVPEGDGPTPGWGCELVSNETDETVAYVEGFDSEEDLRVYLVEAEIEIT